jgi:hypothetical protein
VTNFKFQLKYDTYLTYVYLKLTMSDRNKDSEDIESAQKNQRKIGAAEEDPETTGPAENLREEAAEMVDKDEDSSEPA